MNPKHFGRAMKDVTDLADGVLDERLKALAPKPETPEEEAAEGPEPDELTPDEVARLRALLAQEG